MFSLDFYPKITDFLYQKGVCVSRLRRSLFAMFFLDGPLAIVPAIPLIIVLICAIVFYILPVGKDIKNVQKYPVLYSLISCVGAYTIILNIESSNFMRSSKAFIPYVVIVMFVSLLCEVLALVEAIRKGREKTFKALTLDDVDKRVRFIYTDFFETIKQNNKDERSYIKRVGVILIPLVSLVFMYFVFGTYELYFSNMAELYFVFADILPLSVATLLASVGLSFLIALAIKGKNLDYLSIVIASVGLISYIQCAFLNGNTFIQGEKLATPMWIIQLNLLLWVGVPAVLCFIYKKKKDKLFLKIATGVAGALIIIQGAALPVLLINGLSQNQTKTHHGYHLDGSEQFEVSSEGNVIVFIMDTFYTGYFEDYLKTHPEAYDKYSDFVFYDNIVAEATGTTHAMPYMLTTHPVDFSMPFMESNKKAWNSEEADFFYSSMHNDGYKVRLYSDTDLYCGGAENMVGKIDNVKEYEFTYQTEQLPTFLALSSLSLYRYSPYFLKDAFYISDVRFLNEHTKSDSVHGVDTSKHRDITETSAERGIAFYNDDYYLGVEKGLTVTSDEKLCIFTHMQGLHEPYYDEKGPVDHYTVATNGCMKIFDDYVDQLKEIGVYDNSTIILTADHGISIGIFDSAAVMLIKPAGRKGDKLVVDSSPGVLHSDLIPTILDCSGLPYENLGCSFFDLDENTKRTRKIRTLRHDDNLPNVPKCNSYGYSVVNAYYDYEFDCHWKDIPKDIQPSDEQGITDYWW